MDYRQRIARVLDFIGKNLDEKLSLAQLSEQACFSKFHFHRLFTAFTGVSLSQYIKWLRLKRAAHQLILDKQTPIINIAINAGFDSHEAFSRAFKQACGVSPSVFKTNNDMSMWDEPIYCLPTTGEETMNVEIKQQAKTRIAVVEHLGDPNTLGNSLNKLIDWAKAQTIDLKPTPGAAFGLGYEDPKNSAKETFRFDLGLKVPENLVLDDNVIEKYLPAGRYATVMHKGSHDNLGDSIYGLLRDWLPKSGEELADFPIAFCYHNFSHEVAETELLTECRLLLK